MKQTRESFIRDLSAFISCGGMVASNGGKAKKEKNLLLPKIWSVLAGKKAK